MSGKIESSVGDQIGAGHVLMIIESMKMEIPVEAECGGTVAEILVNEEDSVEEDQVVAILETLKERAFSQVTFNLHNKCYTNTGTYALLVHGHCWSNGVTSPLVYWYMGIAGPRALLVRRRYWSIGNTGSLALLVHKQYWSIGNTGPLEILVPLVLLGSLCYCSVGQY